MRRQDESPTMLARTRRLDSGEWFASLPDDAPGVWGTGDTEQAALDELCEVYREWARLEDGGAR